jgi:hypothetical protein
VRRQPGFSEKRIDSGLHTALSDHIPRMPLSRRLIRLGTRTRTVYSLADARVVTLSPPLLSSPPVHTKLSRIASSMATQRDVEYYNQMFLDACVLLDGLRLMTTLIVTHYYSPGSSASQSTGRRCVNPFFCVVILIKNHPGTALISPNLKEDYPSNVLR